MNETTLTAVGTLITPVNLRYLPDGTPVTNFRIACNERRRDRETGRWVDHDTLYASVTCWRWLAENVCASFRTGDPIIVRGRIYSRSYEKDGRRNWVTEIEADVVGPDVARCTTSITRTGKPTPDGGAAPTVQSAASSGNWSTAPDDASGAFAADVPARAQAEPVPVAAR
jgi:single-strand DNA-binding protein